MNKKRALLGPDMGAIATFLAIVSLLLRVAPPALVAPLGSPFQTLAWEAGLGTLGYEICFHAASSVGDRPEPGPVPQNKPPHNCVLCCAPASSAGMATPTIDLPIRKEARAERMTASTQTLAALSIHVIRQRGPPTA